MDAIEALDPEHTVPGNSTSATAGIFATYPTDLYQISTTNLFFDQLFGTLTLTLIVNGLTEPRRVDVFFTDDVKTY